MERILEYVVRPTSRVSSRLRDHTHVSFCRQILYHLSHQSRDLYTNVSKHLWSPLTSKFCPVRGNRLYSSLLLTSQRQNPFILALTVTCSLHSGFAKLHREQSPSGSHLGLGASLGMQPWPQVGRQKEEMPIFLAAPSCHTSLGLPTSASVFMSKNIPLICWSHSDQVSDYQPSNAV